MNEMNHQQDGYEKMIGLSMLIELLMKKVSN